MRDDRWGEPTPVWIGDALTDVHEDGRGTPWKRTAAGAWFPDCDCHRPAVITEMRKAEGDRLMSGWEERHAAWQRQHPETPQTPVERPRSDETPEPVHRQLPASLRRFLRSDKKEETP